MRKEEIRDLRGRLGLSQERFAHLMGVSLQSVRRWELGASQPLPLIAARLQEVMRALQAKQNTRGGTPVGQRQRKTAEDQNTDIDLGELGGIFKGMGGLFDLVTKLAEEGNGERSGVVEKDILGGKGKAVYGFSVRVGTAGKPVIESFGNVRNTAEGPMVADVREPLVDVFDEEGEIRVVAEMPGVDEKDIKPEIRGDILVLSADAKQRKYRKEVLLPCAVKAEGKAQSYRNGLLELKLKKA